MTTNNLNNECLNDFVIGEGASGSTRKLRVENDNNTASSQAAIETYVGGTTSDDTFIRHVVGASHSYAHGIDNDDSQSFNIAYTSSGSATPASTKAIKSTTDGELLYPNQPLFRAYSTSGATNATGDNTEIDIPYDTENLDQDSNFNTGTYTFTAPRDGKYLFVMGIAWEGTTTANHWGQYTFLEANGTERIVTTATRMNSTGPDYLSYTAMGMIDLSASDTVKVIGAVGNDTKVIGIPAGSSTGYQGTFFAGMLLG